MIQNVMQNEKAAPMKKENRITRRIAFPVVLLTAALLFAGCAPLFGQPAVDRDSALAVRVKAALVRSPELNAAPIDVEATGGEVRLRGFVETDRLKKAAGQVAERVEGVNQVINDIRIK